MNEPRFEKDWFFGHIEDWESILQPFRDQPNLQFLEIGALEGRATRWLFENIVTHPSSYITVVDPHYETDVYDGTPMPILFQNFHHNTDPFRSRLCYIRDASVNVGPTLNASYYDFVYVDGAHDEVSALHDCRLAFRVLKPEGVCIVDDFNQPFSGVIAAVEKIGEEFKEKIMGKKTPTGQFMFMKNESLYPS